MVIRWVVLAVAALLAASPVWAHSFLQHTSPPAGAELRSAPASVKIIFTEAVEPRFSSIEVRDSAGTRVDTGSTYADGTATALAVGLSKLPPGTYTVSWRAASVDTHKSEGKYTFSVLP